MGKGAKIAIQAFLQTVGNMHVDAKALFHFRSPFRFLIVLYHVLVAPSIGCGKIGKFSHAFHPFPLIKAPDRLTIRTSGKTESKEDLTMIMDRIALIIAIIGALNWGSIGLFRFDLVAWLLGGQTALGSRIVYTVVALAGIWCVSLLFRARERFEALDE
jgi:uncharacterized membrane protein YuzA (DUF378 family)